MSDEPSLTDEAGHLRLAEIRRELDGRLAGVPELRRVVIRPGPLAGRALWVDDPVFRIEHHVGEAEVSPPGDTSALLALAERLMARPLDRSRPLWRMWLVTGLADGRVGVLILLHHALADGQAAMRMVRTLLEAPLPPGAPPPAKTSTPEPPPPWGVLVRDNVRTTLASARHLVRPATWRLAADVIRAAREVRRLSRHSPATSLNAPVGPGRRLAAVRLDLAAAKRVARAHGCGVNDVVLGLVAGGVRDLLERRGEPIEQLRPRAGIAVALFSAGHAREAGNDVGSLYVPLPLARRDPGARLPLIAAERTLAKANPMMAVEPVLRAWLGRVGAFRRSLDHQRLVNLAETYLPGPPVPIEILGAPVVDLLPIAPLTGNLALSFVALSYAGRLTVAVRADADRFPDLDVLVAAMERDWLALAGTLAGTPAAPAGSPAAPAGTQLRPSGPVAPA